MPRKPHGRDLPVSAPTSQPLGMHGLITSALGALRRWWTAKRRYRPERRYMRGGQPGGARAVARC